MKATGYASAMLGPTKVARGAIRPTTAVQGLYTQAEADRFHYARCHVYLDDHNLTHVAPPGYQDPRKKYWWRRWYTAIMGPSQRQFFKDNVYPEEQAVRLMHPVPGGHGDRFTHSWIAYPGPNDDERWARDRWEMKNLTPEQLAVKYGVYIPRVHWMNIAQGRGAAIFFWVFLMTNMYHDDDTGHLSHVTMDDFVRELNGFDDISEEDAAIDQWLHPYVSAPMTRRTNPYYTYRPLVYKDSLGASGGTTA
eukprot:TRINITY_DN6548_c0_g1_i1.p1 TRINITY_DN6548_c0_g1~~TRINITY_DN6548_c0_g1_i1.p1  ORF type:complete len:250 (+),score=26.15 TRINITY_DN6548_c0_g1_i1:117-866(+)